MNNLQRYYATVAKFGSSYIWPGNPRFAWKNVTLGVKPYTVAEFLPVLAGKIQSQKTATRPVAGLVEKYEAALSEMLLADPESQALNPDFNPSKPETHPDEYWAFFHSL